MVQPNKLFGRLGNRLFQMAYIYAQMKEGIIPDIYIQDYTLFKKYEEEIKQWFGEGIGFLPYTSIHVRRSGNPDNLQEPNYSENPFYVDLTKTDYYDKAIELFPSSNFLVFSDDTAWCREKWGNDKRFQIMDGSELEDFNMMSSCQNNILANSSFSWWAAFLNMHPNKTVIAPKNWFADGIERCKLPPKWISL